MNPNKARGTRFETDVVECLRAHGLRYVERRAQSGNKDRGDLTGLPGWVAEIKATRSIELGVAMAEAEVEARNAGCTDHVVIIKRRMKPVGQAYAVLPLWLFADLIAYDGRPER